MSNPVVDKQPPPLPNSDGEVVFPDVIKHLVVRLESAKRQHGTYLQTRNGRDALADSLQESIDAVVYTTQAIMERELIRHDLKFMHNLLSDTMKDDKRRYAYKESGELYYNVEISSAVIGAFFEAYDLLTVGVSKENY